jgi:hypothetical protein
MTIAWHAGDYMSVARMNAASIHQMTGEELQEMSADHKSPGMKVFITVNSPDNVYKAGNYYTLSNDLGTWTQDGLSTHTHIDQDSGGALHETLRVNIPTTIDYDKRWARAAMFYTTTASGGTVTDDNTNVRITLDTSATSSGRASFYDGGARQLNFAKNSAFESTLLQSSDTSFKTKVGINAENIEAANNPAVPSYGIEGCSTSGTTWLIWSSSGSNRSTLTTASPIVTASPAVYLVEHDSANSVTLSIDGVSINSKTTDIPSTGLASLNNLYKAGIQNSAAASKILYHYGGPRIVGAT